MKSPRQGRFTALVLVVAAVLLWLVVGPGLALVKGSLVGPDGATLDGYRRFLCGPPGLRDLPNVEWQALRNSVLIALGSVALSALLGVPLAFIFQGYEFPGRRVFAALATVPVLLPPLVGVVAFYFLYAESGVVTRLARLAFGLDRAPWRFDGVTAVLVVHAYSMYVYFYAFTTAGLARLDGSQLEAAAMLGAGRARRFATVTLPLLTPALVGAALLVFMMAMASFTAPLMFDVRVLTIQLLESRRNEDWLLMSAETVVLAAVCIAFLALLRFVESRGEYIGGQKGAGAERRVVGRGWPRLALAAFGVTAVLILLLPHAMLVLMSLADDARWTTQILPPRYSLDAYRHLFTSAGGRTPIVNSVEMASAATAANLLFALLAGYLFTRFRFRGRGPMEAAAMLPYAIPGTVIALGLAEWFSVRQWYFGRTVLISTWAILPVAYFVRNLPLTLRAVQSSLAQVDASLEEAAASLGSPPWRVLAGTVLPLARPGLVAGGTLAMIAAIGEFVASWVLYTPANRPLAIEMWNQMRHSYFARSAAYGVVVIAAIALMLVVSQRSGAAREAALTA